MIDTPRIVHTQAVETAAIRLAVPRSDMPKVMGPGVAELMATLAAQGIAPSGPVLDYHLRMEPGIFDFEIAVPVPRPVNPAGRVRPSRLPAATVARTVYHGSYEGLPEAWEEFEAWIAEQDRRSGPSLWQVYLTNPATHPDPETWLTELNRPLLD
jgi:effector-binding domain-containing protein